MNEEPINDNVDSIESTIVLWWDIGIEPSIRMIVTILYRTREWVVHDRQSKCLFWEVGHIVRAMLGAVGSRLPVKRRFHRSQKRKQNKVRCTMAWLVIFFQKPKKSYSSKLPIPLWIDSPSCNGVPTFPREKSSNTVHYKNIYFIDNSRTLLSEQTCEWRCFVPTYSWKRKLYSKCARSDEECVRVQKASRRSKQTTPKIFVHGIVPVK